MSARPAKVILVVFSLLVVIAIIALAVAAQFAHDGYALPLDDIFLRYRAISWAVLGGLAFVAGLAIVLTAGLRRFVPFEPQGLSDRTLNPELHIRCRNCSVVDRVDDTGARPLPHNCPHCGTQGEYHGPEAGEKGFIFTRMEMKLGCRRCHTTFRIPEPLVRPVYVTCPNCSEKGILRADQRAPDAQSVVLQCTTCGHGYHVYAVSQRWSNQFPCPSCGTENALEQPAAA